VRIEFVVENWGEAVRVYPHIEFKVAELKGNRFVEKVVHSQSSWVVDLGAFSSTLVPFEATFDAATVILTKPPNKIKVKLSREPITEAT
jgi:hypothetical protein